MIDLALHPCLTLSYGLLYSPCVTVSQTFKIETDLSLFGHKTAAANVIESPSLHPFDESKYE